MMFVGRGCPQFSKKSLYSKHSVLITPYEVHFTSLCAQIKISFVCGCVGVPHLQTDKTLDCILFPRWLRSAWRFIFKFLEETSSSVTIMSLFSGLLSPNQTETTDSSPLDRWASMNSRARTISRPWLDSFFLFFATKRVAACSRRGSRSHHGDGGDRGHWGVGHHFPGLLHCPGGGVQTPLLPPSRPAAPLRLQVSESMQKPVYLCQPELSCCFKVL